MVTYTLLTRDLTQSSYNPVNVNHNPYGVQHPQSHSNQWTPNGDTFFQRNQYHAEKTMQRQNPDDGYDKDRKHSQSEVPRKLNPSTNQLHPWNEDQNYLSRFPLSFCGCFVCGGTNHRGSCDFPLAKNWGYDNFFKELTAHKPHTK